jgi:hypothetical protein
VRRGLQKSVIIGCAIGGEVENFAVLAPLCQAAGIAFAPYWSSNPPASGATSISTVLATAGVTQVGISYTLTDAQIMAVTSAATTAAIPVYGWEYLRRYDHNRMVALGCTSHYSDDELSTSIRNTAIQVTLNQTITASTSTGTSLSVLAISKAIPAGATVWFPTSSGDFTTVTTSASISGATTLPIYVVASPPATIPSATAGAASWATQMRSYDSWRFGALLSGDITEPQGTAQGTQYPLTGTWGGASPSWRLPMTNTTAGQSWCPAWIGPDPGAQTSGAHYAIFVFDSLDSSTTRYVSLVDNALDDRFNNPANNNGTGYQYAFNQAGAIDGIVRVVPGAYQGNGMYASGSQSSVSSSISGTGAPIAALPALGAAVTAGTPSTSITLASGLTDALPQGALVALPNGDIVQVTSPAAAGATTVSVGSFLLVSNATTLTAGTTGITTVYAAQSPLLTIPSGATIMLPGGQRVTTTAALAPAPSTNPPLSISVSSFTALSNVSADGNLVAT